MKEQNGQIPPFGKVFLILAVAVVAIFALSVLLGIRLFQKEVRYQILHRDGILLTNIAQFMHSGQGAAELGAWQYVELALDSSEIRDIIAVRVFHPLDELVQQVPASLYAVSLPVADKDILRSGEPVVRYYDAFRFDALYSDLEEIGGTGPSPVVEVISPIVDPDGKPVAAIQYWIDGASVAAEFARVDRYLLTMGSGFILGGILIFSVVFLIARKRLMRMAAILSERNRSLEVANEELARAARTSAIGSVASHLFHGLKNPLAGLKTYLRVVAKDDEAVAITERMQSLINETLNVIRDQDRGTDTFLTLEEFTELTRQRLQNGLNGPSERVVMEHSGNTALRSNKAQLVLLVLVNLIDNALEASSSDTPVRVHLLGNDDAWEVEVIDFGPGLPSPVQKRLFEPVHSSKADGSGIGLAISAVLARHVPAILSLKETGSRGTTFSLHIPL